MGPGQLNTAESPDLSQERSHQTAYASALDRRHQRSAEQSRSLSSPALYGQTIPCMRLVPGLADSYTAARSAPFSETAHCLPPDVLPVPLGTHLQSEGSGCPIEVIHHSAR